MPMQLPDENIEYQFQRLLAPPPRRGRRWPNSRRQHFLPPERLERDQARRRRRSAGRSRPSASCRTRRRRSARSRPGSSTCRRRLLDGFRRKQDASELGKVLRIAQPAHARTWTASSSSASAAATSAAKALFDALCHTYHNEMPAKLRMGKPRIYFEGNNVDNDSLQELFELLENTCVDPDIARGALGRRRHQQVGRHARDGGRVPGRAGARRPKFYGPKSDDAASS